MIKGTYRFYLDNELVYEQSNALTNSGRTIAIKSLLGVIPNFAGTIGYGIGDRQNFTSASSTLISDTTLQFEIGRTAVIGSTLNVSQDNDLLIYSADINDPLSYEIHEVGLYPSLINRANIGVAGETIFDFDRVDLFGKQGTASGSFLENAIESRIGTQMLYIPFTDPTDNYLSYVTTDNTLSFLNSFISRDTFRLAGLNPSENSASISFRFYSDSTNYFEMTFPSPSASGYFISEIEKGSAFLQGNPNWNSISSVRIWQNSASGIYLDGLKIDLGDYIIDTVTGLISRAVLSSPIRKPAGIPITVEYSLALDFNRGVS
jgi:hypothetical protein